MPEGTENFYFQCVSCHTEYSPAEEQLYLCPSCSKENSGDSPPKGVLKTLYDYGSISKQKSNFKSLKDRRFIDVLPVQNRTSLPPLKIGNTPLYAFQKEDHKLFIKDDSQNPTFSFKDRASALVSAFAKEKGLSQIVAASTGNAGSSIAGICASRGQKAVVLVPENAPAGKLMQIMMYGANIIRVKGNYDTAFDLSIKLSEEFGWYNRNTAYNPLTIEGKKTVSFEIFDQLGEQAPNMIFVPAGDGVILSGVYKGFEDLMRLGIIHSIPVIIAVQSEGSDNLVTNLEGDVFVSRKSNTIADSISVDIPRNFHMAKDFILKYQGKGISVTDEEIITAAKELAATFGLFAEPASAAAYAGYVAFQHQQRIPENANVVVLHTGSGLKDINAYTGKFGLPASVEPDINTIRRLIT